MTANQYQIRAKEINKTKVHQAVERLRADNKQAGDELANYAKEIEGKVRPKSLENYVNQLSTIARTINKPFSQFTNKDTKKFFKKVSKGSRYASWQSLRSYFCDHRHYDRMIEKDLRNKWELLMQNIQKPTTPKRLLTQNDLITPEDLDKLLAACRNPRDKALVMTLFETGARLSEVLSMEVQDINLTSQPIEIKIKHSKTEDKKGRRPVYIFRAEPYLKAWLEQHPFNDGKPGFYTGHTPVWVSWQPTHGATETMTTNTAGLMLERLKKRAGIPKQKAIFAHLFRHSRASDLHDNFGLDVKEIKEILGHSKLETTDGYLTINRSTMIAKMQGKADTAMEKRRAQALKHGMPIPCACGITNDPQAAFCYKCGRVVNDAVAKELVKAKDDEAEKIRKEMQAMREEFLNMLREQLKDVPLAALKAERARR